MMWNGDAQKREKVRRCCFCECPPSGNSQSSCSGANRIDLSLMQQLFVPIRSCTMTKCCTLEYRCAIPRDTEVPAKLDVLQEYELWFIDRDFNRPHAVKEVTLALSVFQMSVIFRRVISQSIKRPAFIHAQFLKLSVTKLTVYDVVACCDHDGHVFSFPLWRPQLVYVPAVWTLVNSAICHGCRACVPFDSRNKPLFFP